jgi:hypothetical protein
MIPLLCIRFDLRGKTASEKYHTKMKDEMQEIRAQNLPLSGLLDIKLALLILGMRQKDQSL